MRTLKHLTVGVALSILLTTTGCRHTGGPGVHHGNDLLFNPEGLLHFGHLQGPVRCAQRFGEGKVRLSFPNGKKRLVGRCAGGLRVGPWKAWYNNGAVAWKATYDSGHFTGTLKIFHPNDRRLAVMAFQQGMLNGTYKAWWSNGKLRAKGTFTANKRSGCWETWHDNGHKASKGTYADDRKVLSWVYWTASGQKRKETLGGEATQGRCLIVF